MFPHLPVFEGLSHFFVKHWHGPIKEKLAHVPSHWYLSRGYAVSRVWMHASYDWFSGQRSCLNVIQTCTSYNNFNWVIILIGVYLWGWSMHCWRRCFHPWSWRYRHWDKHPWKLCSHFWAMHPWRWGGRVVFWLGRLRLAIMAPFSTFS